jgi:hypothetical protein
VDEVKSGRAPATQAASDLAIFMAFAGNRGIRLRAARWKYPLQVVGALCAIMKKPPGSRAGGCLPERPKAARTFDQNT